MGRPTKLNADVQQTLAFAITEGASVEHACDYACITPRTFYNWMERGESHEEQDDLYVQFFHTITRARGRGIVNALATISTAAQASDWRAAAWRLAHCYPAEYGGKVQIQGDHDHPLRVLQEMPQDQLTAKIAQLLVTLGYVSAPAALPAATSETTTPEDLRCPGAAWPASPASNL
jgi:hypothetical protein